MLFGLLAAAAEQKDRTLVSLVFDTIGMPRNDGFTPMTRRERFDFIVLILLFGVNVAALVSS
jgi:hypothetical protein